MSRGTVVSRRQPRIPPTTKAWPESRYMSRRHMRLHLRAKEQSPTIMNAIEAKPKMGSKIKTYKLGDLARTVRGLRRKV